MGGMCFPGLDQTVVCTEGKKSEVPKPRANEPTRLVKLPAEQAFGTHAMGSRNTRDIPLPITTALTHGTATVVAFVTKGSEAFTTDWKVDTIEPSLSPAELKRHFDEAIRVTFAPSSTGTVHGELEISVAWADGHLEKQIIALTGSGYPIDRLPNWPDTASSTTSPSVLPVSPAGSVRPGVEDAKYNAALDFELKEASVEFSQVISAMRRGMQHTKDTSQGFRAAREDDSIWISLAKFALTMGMSAVVTPISGFIAKRFLDVVEFDLMQVEGVFADPDTVKAASKLLEKPIKALGDAALNSTIRGARKPGQGGRTDAVASFFEGQSAAIDEFGAQNTHGLHRIWAELLVLAETQPKVATAAMRGLGAAFKLQADDASEAQKVASASAWTTFKARDALGAETVVTDHGQREVTNMTAAREWTGHGLRAPEGRDGLLEVQVAIREGRTHVTGARIDGIAQPLAEMLLRLDLRTAQIPLRINVNEGGAFLTVDEVGRVRASGALVLFSDDGVPTAEEGRVHDGAQRAVDLVLSKTLAGWGISRILTNDAAATKVPT